MWAESILCHLMRTWSDTIVEADQNGMVGSMMQDLAFAIPGVDEAMGFAEIMKYVVTLIVQDKRHNANEL